MWFDANRWIITRTPTEHAVNPSATLTLPLARSLPLSKSETCRSCMLPPVPVPVTVKSDVLIAEPLGVVTETLPEVAPAGTVAVSCVYELYC